MIIYSPTGTQLLDAPVTKEAIVKYALMSDYYIELPLNQHQYLQIPQGSYILYKGRKFEIMAPVYPEFDNSTGGYKYSLLFQAQQNHMKKFVCFWLGGPNPEAVFHNTSDLASFGALIVANMNKALGTDNWRLGTVSVENSDAAKLVSFDGDKCWDAVNTIAETFEVEWWTEESGGIITLNFGKQITGTAEEFKRGEVVKTIPAKKGDDSSYGTRFYVFGSTRNLTRDYGQAEQGGETNHVSEIRLRLPDGQSYIDAIPNLDKSAIVEQVVFFDDIYPKNTETVASVETIDRVLIEGRTDTAYVMVCPDTPFVPSDVIAGETLGAHFTSGDLMGWDFELALIDNEGNNIDPATWKPEDDFNKKFEIIAQVETSGGSEHIIPNENLRPRGEDDERGPDTFVLTGVKLPKQRIDEAEQELLTAGTSYAAKHSSDTDVYDCGTNPVYCQINDKNYEAGQAVRLVDPRFGNNGRLSRIQGYEKKLYNEYIATYTIGDNTPYSRMGSIESDVKATLYSQRIGVTERGASIYLITRYDSTFPSDANAYSARRAMWEFANKQAADTFKGRMTFNAGAQFGNFAGGVNGLGGFIDNNGNSELDSLKLRRFLEVPEFRYNRVDVTMGDTWFAPCAGIIESVDAEAKTITLKLEEGEIGSPRVGDICMGIFHSSDYSNNATEDYDDSKGNRRFAGFATCYFRITETLDTTSYKTFKYELRPLSAAYPKQYHPASSMTFVGYGSFSNADRRTSRYETRTYQRYLRGVSDWEFTAENIAAQFGDLSNLSVYGLAMSGYSAYLDNIYMQGMLRSLDGTFIIDTKTRSLLMASGETGIGLAYNPAQGLKIGAVFDPATGRFQKEYDIPQIAQDTADAKAAAEAANTAAGNAATATTNLKIYVDGAFRDGVVDENEKFAISGYKKPLEETMAGVQATYATLYANTYLTGTPKSELATKYTQLNNAKTTLLLAIDTAIADSSITETEKANVNTAYDDFNAKVATFNIAVENANKAIQDAIHQFADDATGNVRTTVIDASNLDQDTYYPVTIKLKLSVRPEIHIYNNLWDGIVPNWSTHVGGFSCILVWTDIATTYGVHVAEPVVSKFQYFYTKDNVTPIGSLGQIPVSAEEYVYVRGGGKYWFKCSFVDSEPILHTETYIPSGGGELPLKTSVVAPISLQQQADATKSAAEATQTAVYGLKNFTDTAFADGIVDRAEAAAIEKYANSVTETSKAADASYTTIYNNVMLGGSAKSNLQAAKSAFDTAVADLLASISIAASDGEASEAEREDVNAKYAIFNTAYATLTMRIEEAQKYIQTAINATAQDAHQLSSVLLDYINLLNESVIPDLQNQIDRQIISYNGADVPTLSNYPASEWTTAEERNRHINDYYDRKITADGTVAYERYKFVLENNVYQWVRIADSGAAEAQAKAMEALGVADSKNKVYFGDATPSVPYSINDLWFKSSGNIYISNADKKKDALGSISDWQLANDAQIRLRQMSSDNVISQEEKASLRNTLLQREKEMVAYKSDASKYGVSISALNTAYLNLVNFLTGTIAVNNDTDTEITSDQRISYNTYFASYDTEVSRFSNLVADKRSTDYTDKQVDSLQKKIDAAQKAAEEANSKLTQWASDNVISPPEKTGLKLQQADIQAEYAQIVNEGSQYQLSTIAYATAYRAAVTALTKYTASTPELIPVDEDYANIARYYTARGMLLGMIAEAAKRIMDDTASAVSDIDYLKQLFPVSLEVDGVVIARVLAVKNDAGTAVTSFFNGSAVYKDSEHGICMIATGMYGLSNWETAKTRIYADGAIITDKLIATNANISGNITASSGNIGGFKINDPTSDFYNPSLNFTTPSPIAHGNYSIELGGWGMAVSRGRAGSNFDDRIVIAPASAYKGFPPAEAENNVSMGIQAYSSVLYKSNIALMLNAGTALSSVEIIPGDHALYISKGDICGFRLRTQTMTSGHNAVDMDSIIFSEATAATGVTLPASPQAGQIYFIRKVNSGNVSVWVGNQSTQNIRKNYNTSAKYVTIEYGHLGIFMWNEKGNYWTANYCPNM